MGWVTSVLILASFGYISTTSSRKFPFGSELQDTNADDVTDNIPSINPEEDLELRRIGKGLAEILVRKWPGNELPLVYVEESAPKVDEESNEEYQNLDENEGDSQVREVPYKRTRYYRKYPWKRQNSRYPYEAENRYMCQPSKDDVFRLLVALHEARQGGRGRTINFCNRKRPASSIFTNIRFLGRRK